MSFEGHILEEFEEVMVRFGGACGGYVKNWNMVAYEAPVGANNKKCHTKSTTSRVRRRVSMWCSTQLALEPN